MPQRLAYPANLETDADGRVLVTFPDFGWGATDGADRAEALLEAIDCLEEIIAGTMRERADLPVPSPAHGRPVVTPGAVIAAKAALYDAMRQAGVNKSELARRLGVGEPEARRMLDTKHPTKMARLEDALRLLGKGILVEVRDVA